MGDNRQLRRKALDVVFLGLEVLERDEDRKIDVLDAVGFQLPAEFRLDKLPDLEAVWPDDAATAHLGNLG